MRFYLTILVLFVSTASVRADVIVADVNSTEGDSPGYFRAYYDPSDLFTPTEVIFEVAQDSNYGIFGLDETPIGFIDPQALVWDVTIDGDFGEISNGLPTVPRPMGLHTDELRIVKSDTESYVTFGDTGRLDLEWDNVRVIVPEPSAAALIILGCLTGLCLLSGRGR